METTPLIRDSQITSHLPKTRCRWENRTELVEVDHMEVATRLQATRLQATITSAKAEAMAVSKTWLSSTSTDVSSASKNTTIGLTASTTRNCACKVNSPTFSHYFLKRLHQRRMLRWWLHKGFKSKKAVKVSHAAPDLHFIGSAQLLQEKRNR